MPRFFGPKPIVVPPRLPWEPIEIELPWHEKLRRMPRSRWVVLLLSVLVTSIIVFGFFIDAHKNMPKPTLKLVYVNSWPATRSADDIAADRAAEKAEYERRFAESRAYIATLPPDKQQEARDQYNAFAAALGPSLRPDDYVPPEPVAPSPKSPPPAPKP